MILFFIKVQRVSSNLIVFQYSGLLELLNQQFVELLKWQGQLLINSMELKNDSIVKNSHSCSALYKMVMNNPIKCSSMNKKCYSIL